MSRPKLKFTLSEDLRIKLDPKLKAQLLRYANRRDNGIASVSARRAIRLLLDNEELDNSLLTNELDKEQKLGNKE